MDEIKLYCIVSREAVKIAKHVPGKMAAQAGHAYVNSLLDSMERFPQQAKDYIESDHHPKVTLIADEAELHALWRLYKDKFGVALIKDAGRTVFKNEDGTPRPTITALGIGPIRASEREERLAALRPW